MAAALLHRLLTPPPIGGGSAIAIVGIEADAAPSLDDFVARSRLAVPPGGGGLRNLMGIDEGLVLRDSPTTAQLMPHGGAAVLAALSAALASAGCPPATDAPDPRRLYPEALDLIEACALDAVARSPSPLAVDIILRQRDIWRARGAPQRAAAAAKRTRPLGRLLSPPIVLLLGRPNIGKSALTNAIAGRAVSVVADEPGTTRDHVGVMIDLAGLVVRWIDAPGLTENPISSLDRAAIELAQGLVPAADLVVRCLDCSDPAPPRLSADPDAAAITVGLRADLAPSAASRATPLLTSARTGRGIVELALAVRRALITDEQLASRDPWRFHPALPA